MNAIFNISGIEVTAKATAIATVEKWNSTKVQSRIYLTANGAKCWFNYYAPNEVATVEDLANAFYCLVSDAIAFENATDIDEFAREFGYTSISECIAAYKGCKANAAKVARLQLDAFEVADYLQENYNC